MDFALGPAHVAAGNVDFGLVATVLLGVRVDPAVLRMTLAVVLLGAGLALLAVTMLRSRKARAEVGA